VPSDADITTRAVAVSPEPPGNVRLLLCRPQGGLNDILCQIERACRYAERFARTVVVDTDYLHTEYVRDAFSRYFVSEQARLVLDPGEIRARLDDLDVFPDFLAGRVNRYRARYDHNVKNFVDEETGRAISFDFDTDYPQPLLVHHACGGGVLSIGALSRMRLSENLASLLRERLAAIGRDYVALHIRNTDYRTEYEEWLAENRSKLAGPVFVATDNRATVARCRSILGAERIHSFAKLEAEGEEPLHPIADRKDAYRRNCDAILDLLMLALAKQLYVFQIMPNPNGVSYSGFSVLAANLKNCETMLRRLVAGGPR
jgi:hypothetical protein